METRETITFFTAKRLSSFTLTELALLSQHFDRVVAVTSDQNAQLPPEIDCIVTGTAAHYQNKWLHILRHGLGLLPVLYRDLNHVKDGQKVNGQYLLNAFSVLLRCSQTTEHLKKNGHFESGTFYSFFMNDYALVLAIAKERGYIKRFISRAHGRDIIEEREPRFQKIPFQRYKMRQVEAIFGVSRMTVEYLKQRFPEHAQKCQLSYLGTLDHGMAPIPAVTDPFVFVTIGRVRNVKRFHLAGEILKHLNVPFTWIHFGDEAEGDPTVTAFHQVIDELMLKPNATVDCKGFIPNSEVLAFLKNFPVDVLINTSQYEGLPVSIQEAMSFGIPCVATDVGGTREIVNDETGLLIPADFDTREIALKLEQFLEKRTRSKSFRAQVRGFWEKQLKSVKNFEDFLVHMK